MGSFKATPAQSAAISSRGSALLVSAGAGSGKTKVLTERLMSYITDPVEPAELDSFLIITFTRAAAGELKGRIMDEIAQSLAQEPGNRRLRRQSALCQRAQIGTIHSFCAEVLRRYSHVLSLPPDFKIVDDDRAAAMKSAALERTMEQRYADVGKYPGFGLLADTVGVGRDDSRLTALVLTLHEKMQCHARPESWAREQVRLLERPAADVSETQWGAELMGWAGAAAEYWRSELERLLNLMQAEERIYAAYGESVAQTADCIGELSRSLAIGWDRARECLPIRFPTLGRLVKSPDARLSDTVKARRDACKKAMAALSEAFYSDSAQLLKELEETAPAMKALLSLTLDFDRAYAADKRRNGLVDYADLEHMTARLLTDENGEPTQAAEELSQRYTQIMVDEYQDVSRVQDAIFAAVSRKGKNLFMVGDVKQSIYRFRLADPGIFTEKYLSYADSRSAGRGDAQRIILQENFRSRKEVINAVNSVFRSCMSAALGDMDYDGDAALKYAADYPGEVPVPELLLLQLPEAQSDEDAPDKTALEAALVADKIAQLMSSGVTVSSKAGQRALEYGDIAILLRSANACGGIYARALEQRGIPVASGQGAGFFTSVEISTVMSMLALIDNPHQDIPLIAVLRSASFGFTPDELSLIRASERTGDFYTALVTAAAGGGRAADFVERLLRLREPAADLPAAELVWSVLTELDMLAVCGAMDGAEQRRANLMELIELSERFESTGYRGLHRFVTWLRRLADKGQEPSTGAPEASAVQIMTVHRSKGLEFPVVFLSDTARRFNRQDSRDTVLVHPQLGLGPKLTDLERRLEYPTIARTAIKQRLEREMLSEEMRLLYVALTRARERLFMTAALKAPADALEKAATAVTKPMAPQVLAAAAAPVNWLIYAALADGGENITVSICSPGDETETAAEKQTADTGCEADKVEDLRRRLEYVYPHSEAEGLPSKVTATELKGAEESDADALSIAPGTGRGFRPPDFARRDRPLTGRERGIAAHLALQYMDFSRANSLEGIKTEIERLRSERFLSDREAEAADARMLHRFFSSPLGRRILSAETIHREFKFSLLCDAQELFGSAEGEKLLLQGVVDCCIEEPDGLVIVDYKTDTVKGEDELAGRAELYRGQLDAYARSLQRIFGRKVKERILYFLSAGKELAL